MQEIIDMQSSWESYLHTHPSSSAVSQKTYFNQVNCALVPDDCLFVVPGSSTPVTDTPAELAIFKADRRPIPYPGMSKIGEEERMNFCLEYAHSMHLDAGDCCFYRNTLWHCGVYNPAQPRATLHDIVDTPEFDVGAAERLRPILKADTAKLPRPIFARFHEVCEGNRCKYRICQDISQECSVH